MTASTKIRDRILEQLLLQAIERYGSKRTSQLRPALSALAEDLALIGQFRLEADDSI